MLEYANIRSGTRLSDWRVANGRTEPYDIRMWCLGNEMDGPWQLGHGTADEYGQLASKTAKRDAPDRPRPRARGVRQLERADAHLRRVGARRARAHLRRRRLHLVPRLLRASRTATSAASSPRPSNMDHFIDSVVATADHVKAVKRQRQDASTSRSTSGTSGTSSRYMNVDKITDVDAVAGRAAPARGLLLGARRRRVRQPADLAAQARRPRDRGEPRPARQRDRADHDRARRPGLAPDHLLPVRRDLAARARRGPRAEARQLRTYDTERYGVGQLVDAVATHDDETGETTVFLVNRSMDDERRVSSSTRSLLGAVAIESAHTLHDDDIHAANTLADQERVALRDERLVRRSPTASMRSRCRPCRGRRCRCRSRASQAVRPCTG